MRSSPRRSAQRRRVSRRANARVLGGYVSVTVAASALKAWQTVISSYPVGWLAKTNVIVWDTITLAATLGALALGVREMVLAYFMRKEYEEDLTALLQNQRQQAEMLQTLMEESRQQREADVARAQHEAVRAEQEAARAEQEAARAEQEAARAQQEAARAQRDAESIRQLTEHIHRLLERLDRSGNGDNSTNSENPN